MGWGKHKLESRVLGEISVTSDMQMIPPLMAESEEKLKSVLMKVKEESEKVGIKLNIQKTKIMASGPTTSSLQYSCLENPMDGGAWWATVHEVAKSRTRLSNFTFIH